jgi:hypothetical protein
MEIDKCKLSLLTHARAFDHRQMSASVHLTVPGYGRSAKTCHSEQETVSSQDVAMTLSLATISLPTHHLPRTPDPSNNTNTVSNQPTNPLPLPLGLVLPLP